MTQPTTTCSGPVADPLGDYGGQIIDFACSPEPLVRIGHSLTFSPQRNVENTIPLREADFLRLTDGTQLTSPGALAPGVTVEMFDLYLYSIDAAAKWQGWSVSAEGFFRWLEGIAGDGAVPRTSLYERGYYVEGGRFLIERTLDVNLRYSETDGPFGRRTEYAAGANWHPLQDERFKLSFDVTRLDGSPLNNTASDILVGDDGMLYRTQFQAEY